MIKFETTDNKQAVGSVRVDSENELMLSINGVDVLYIDKYSGTIVRMYFDESEARRLRDLGFETEESVTSSNHRLKDEHTDEEE